MRRLRRGTTSFSYDPSSYLAHHHRTKGIPENTTVSSICAHPALHSVVVAPRGSKSCSAGRTEKSITAPFCYGQRLSSALIELSPSSSREGRRKSTLHNLSEPWLRKPFQNWAVRERPLASSESNQGTRLAGCGARNDLPLDAGLWILLDATALQPPECAPATAFEVGFEGLLVASEPCSPHPLCQDSRESGESNSELRPQLLLQMVFGFRILCRYTIEEEQGILKVQPLASQVG